MKIALITAGAAGMYCGSCMKDNTLAAALNAIGHDALLIPTYTPIRTDEEDVSQSRVFFGGINVFLLGSHEFQSPHFLTFIQAKELGGHVRQGEKGLPVGDGLDRDRGACPIFRPPL